MSDLDQLLKEAVATGDHKAVSDLVNSEWLRFQITLAKLTNPEMETLTYIKFPIELDNGGTYLMTLMHVKGPKIGLKSE
jgi:hypothetical protein